MGTNNPQREAVSLAALPAELLRLIISHLASQHDHSSLLNLGRCSKRLSVLALPPAKAVFYHRIEIVPKIYVNLNDAVTRVIRKLTRERAFIHVKVLILGCWLPPPSGSWNPAIRLLERLPSLTDFHWLPQDDKLPLCLLDVLTRHAPACRLHLEQQYLLKSMKAGPRVDPYELQLMASPHLHRAIVHCHEDYWADMYDGHDMDGLNDTKITGGPVGLITRAAPSLKELDVQWCHRNGWHFWTETPLTRFHDVNNNSSSPRATLEILRILKTHGMCVCGCVSRVHLIRVNTVLDYSFLHTLELQAASKGALEFLSTDVCFPRLKSLAINVKWTGHGETSEAYYAAATRFLSTLPPLSELIIEGWHPFLEITSQVEHHGRNLRKMTLQNERTSWSPSKTDLLSLAMHCPRLESFTLTIQRYEGNASEVAMYRALGSIPRLQHINLTLRSRHPPLRPPVRTDLTPGETGSGPRSHAQPPASSKSKSEGQEYCLRTEFINSAIDSTLATSIFHTISSGKPHPGLNPLQTIHIQPQEVGVRAPGWIVTSKAGCTDWRDRIVVATAFVDAGEDAKKSRVWLEPESVEGKVFCGIWPQILRQRRRTTKKLQYKREMEKKRGVSRRRYSWRSLPLVLGDCEMRETTG